MKIVLLNVATLPVYHQELADLLIDAVSHGASVGYDAPVSYEEAESYFHRLRPAVAQGERFLWIARDQDGIAGSIQLECCQKDNGRNRAEVQNLLVRSGKRRLGVGRQLLATLEKTALSQRRGLLYLNTQSGSPAESFYRSQGYRLLGELPDYACTPDGFYHPTAIYYKRLFAVNNTVRAIAS
ncbi:GNAT family N-acetyltransferase [Affinibrenneria salicis]|uniref:GNAT family N-acetyltransferase n=1 Tax=Affinibrenneria salicis TaxID=2590031 RepID=A0A5J5FR02_9GAMM|nr:GNAT family N-acetyltransferase [Affinibrenneria salicis]KAA8993792.1 GNAT family N-acetyltransferase [Affinibrenneria salicis]